MGSWIWNQIWVVGESQDELGSNTLSSSLHCEPFQKSTRTSSPLGSDLPAATRAAWSIVKLTAYPGTPAAAPVVIVNGTR